MIENDFHKYMECINEKRLNWKLHEGRIMLPQFTSKNSSITFDLLAAGLRRSFRLSRKDRQSSSGEANTSDPTEPELLTYEEVTRYQQRPSERPRLVVLIGKGMREICSEGNHWCIRLDKG